MTIGTFSLVRNESTWIAAHLLNIIPWVDEVVLFDGNSTDGTLEIIEAIQAYEKHGEKIKLFRDKDPKDLKDDYVRLFDECLRSLGTDLAWFLHPDMHILNPEHIALVKDSPAVCLSTSVRSFGGEPGGKLFEMSGRAKEWKHIYRLRNPDLGCHYFGHYGAWNEDCYFRDITGDQHYLYDDFNDYPYSIAKSGLEILHFSDVRPHARRVDRMLKCLANNNWSAEKALERVKSHPRVTFKDGEGFKFTETQYPSAMVADREKYRHLEKGAHAIA